MKKILLSIIALCITLTMFCACNNEKPAGGSWAHVIGIKLNIENDDGYWETSDNTDIELSYGNSYMLDITLLRTTGSSPGYINKEFIEVIYDETVVTISEHNPDELYDYRYDIVCLKTEAPVTVKVTAGTFSDEITFKFVD